MLYGKLNPDKSVTELIDTRKLLKLFPNTSFPAKITDEILEPFGFVCIDTVPPPSDLKQSVDKRYSFTVELIDGKYTRVVGLESVEPNEAEIRKVEKFKEIRKRRNRLLAESDYTQLVDISHLKSEWAVYRQALRDLPNSGVDPFQIEFPPKPE